MDNKKEKCIRQVANWSHIELTDRFDKPKFNKDKLNKKLKISSPKLFTMLNNIEELDKKDYKKKKKYFKHYIFSDLKNGYGSKILTSAFISAGYNLAMKSKGSKIILDEEVLNNGSNKNFLVLSSTSLWNKQFDKSLVNKILSVYNQRPDNIYGNKVRFIILDSGFKEGIDLYDVKYTHIFEQQRTMSDLIQAIGRTTRACGQVGLPFIKNKGWELDVYNYKLYKPVTNFLFFKKKEKLLDLIRKENEILQFQLNLQNEILSLIQKSSVDYELNKNINEYNSKKSWKKIALKSFLIAAGIGAGIGIGVGVNNLLKNKAIQKQNIEDFANFVKRLGKKRITYN